MIHPRREEVFVDDLLSGKGVFACISISNNGPVGQMVESEVGLGIEVHAIRIRVRSNWQLKRRARIGRIRSRRV